MLGILQLIHGPCQARLSLPEPSFCEALLLLPNAAVFPIRLLSPGAPDIVWTLHRDLWQGGQTPTLLGGLVCDEGPGQYCLGPKPSLSFYFFPFLSLTQA